MELPHYIFKHGIKLNCEEETRQNMVQSEHNAIQVLVTLH